MGAAAAESRWKNREAKKGIPAPGVGGDGTANSLAQTLLGMAPATAPGETQILSLCHSPPSLPILH